MDFLKISKKYLKQGGVEIFPKFIIGKSNDLMIRGGDFYAIWVEERGLWSTDEDDVKMLIDRALDEYVQEHYKNHDTNINVSYMWDSDSGSIDRWHKYCQKQQRDFYHNLDERLVFANDKAKKRDYASKRLSYPLEPCDTPAYETIMSTLYSEDERHKLEWAIGAIVTGDSKTIQKFIVLYGSAGTGKSTVLNIIQDLFDGYYGVFDAKSLGSSSNDFALEDFKNNPLVAIQHDGDLSRIEDNTRLNSLVSHEMMTMNEKFKSKYSIRFNSFLFMGTNKPVKITDGKSGLLRRLIDVSPSGDKLDSKTYRDSMKKIPFELGGIACHCRDVYLNNPYAYDSYIPTSMLGASNDFYNYVIDVYHIFKRDDATTLKAAWELYKTFCDEANIQYPLNQRNFKEELKNYFSIFEDRFALDDGTRVRSYYSGFLTSKFEPNENPTIIKKIDEAVIPNWLDLTVSPSNFDIQCCDYDAQYAKENETPLTYWDAVNSSLSTIDTSKLHYVKVPLNHIVIDFDIKDAAGNKNYDLNIAAASGWPPTYAEVSKGGAGLHLHYIYSGDPEKLSRIFDDEIEVKVFTGNMSLRRKLTKCNDLTIATISSGLPLKGEKMVNKDIIATERGLRTTIKKCINKEIHAGTKPSIDFIYKILTDAKEQGLKYDVSDLRNVVIAFAAQSTNQSNYCLALVNDMPFKSDEEIDNACGGDDDKPMVFFDVEVFPNLFLVNWKIRGVDKPIVRMFNPTSEHIEDLLGMKLVGFNCRRYDNHIMYARLMGYDNLQLYHLSKKIIDEGILKAGFLEAYNLSYTDIYDFASAGNKMSLKKLEIKMGIHHQELGLPWDEPVPEELWSKVAEYCDNDVLATEAAFDYLSADWTARQILADLAGMTVNDTTNTLTTRIIFGNNRKPQDQFKYRNLAEPVYELDHDMREFLDETFPEMMDTTHGEANSLLPYFPGYKYSYGKSTYKDINENNPDKERRLVGEGGFVYAETGMFGNVALLDAVSMHPFSIMAECLFGPKFTRAFRDIVFGRVSIKHKAWADVNAMLDGKLTPYIQKVLDGKMTAKDLANALKTAINAVYGLTSASFSTAFRDNRNIDNIVAKRGALFMIDLKEAVQARGYTVAHIKTDSIKIPDATPEIIEFVMAFGLRYGYTFEHEATYERMCLVNKAVYIAKFATPEQCEKLYGYAPGDCVDNGGKWTATGTQFAVPYVFKKLFSGENIVFEDLCETFQVNKGDLHLDMNECLPDVSAFEKDLDKLTKKLKDGKISQDQYDLLISELTDIIEKGHDLHFVGRVGQFCPVKPGVGGGVLYRVANDRLYNASGATGYRWLESEVVKNSGSQDNIDLNFYKTLVDTAIDTINNHGDFEWFVSNDPYIMDMDGSKSAPIEYGPSDSHLYDDYVELPWE